ncbi:MAG: AmmeMemoRadiSam system radical SAM enzyme [Lachnospiraceae bacterium]|nr:AmmeMemoRadiSam system radical SAM enzyme [Lachnospiraceae bacterium]
MARCEVCFRHCEIKEGESGFCGARTCRNGEVVPKHNGLLSALALDPIEKKPLRRFHPGSLILSAGGYGCNLRCPFCQNSEISWSEEALHPGRNGRRTTPRELADTAVRYRKNGNIGLAFTYNEPLVSYEFVRDTARLIHEEGMFNVLVTNGCASLTVLEELTPYIDAMNIDLKGFTEHYYGDVLKGNLAMVKDFIREAARICHVELTTLIVPGENDSVEEMREISGWIASLDTKEGHAGGRDIPLHISRFFPRFHMTDRAATDVGMIYRLKEVAEEKLRYVYTGNC